MNYGKFFRLNKNLSRIEEGYAVYDYIDLPAYFTRSLNNHMSPKYPVSMTVLADSVVFKLHYSAYKIEESSDVLPDQTDSRYPKYLYDIKDKTQDGDLKSGDITKIVHMEETVLELPYTDTVGRNLSDTIRDIYNTNFPLISYASDESGADVKLKDSSGGRFLHNLIRKRYLEENVKEENDIHSHFYHSLRRISDGTPSYSTIWLMGLVMGDRDNVRYVRTDKKGNIVGFLRKLLLDFMFDLKHSDVFQNSSQFQKMYSGLMSNFYFSALMHKCEYYYYRKLTKQAIDDNEMMDDTISKEENKKRIEEGKKCITALYASELVKAEDLWIKDIMNPLAEKEFEHKYPGKHNLLREYFEYYSFKQWPSWFAEPEEEMKRVCFSMKDKDGERHICNADTLVRYLNLKTESGDAVIDKMVELRNDGKERISKWFLKQYAFSDVLHLHLFKYANFLFLVLFAIPILASLFWRKKLKEHYFDYLLHESVLIIVIIVLPIACYWIWNRINYRTDNNQEKKKTKRRISPIVITRLKIIAEKVTWVILCIISVIFVISKEYEWDRIPTISIWYSLLVPVAYVAYSSYKRRGFKGVLPDIIRDMISCLHLFLPRLVASITLAWITLSMGFDLYVSYFDAPPRTGYIIGICVIVTLFVMYSINLVIPHSPPLRKLLRSIELMIVSYFISLSVGFVIINFLGEKFLERGGYMSEYYTQYVENEEDSSINRFVKINGKLEHKNITGDIKLNYDSIESNCIGYAQKIIMKMDSTSSDENDTNHYSKRLASDLINVYHSTKNTKGELKAIYPVAAKIKFWGIDFFVLRDFLIMFAFIAMFWGIFIQLIIFGDNKQMTEL